VEDEDYVCDRADGCVTVIVWKKINDAINEVVDGITLQDLLDWQSEQNGQYII
jgi:DNA-binding IscR family transcriptional regulator